MIKASVTLALIAASHVAAQEVASYATRHDERRLSPSGRKLQDDYYCEYDVQGLDSSTCCDTAGICAADLWDCMEIVDFTKVSAA